ncbi:signal peptidase I [Frondihabitans peucedani]|uniref:Signal peptidase I n=1 Tax=Frondihabitans peucedani TaxID=598626 RepID=A0ABP8E0F4_9MICO
MTDTRQPEATTVVSAGVVADIRIGASPRRRRARVVQTVAIWTGAALATALVVLALVFRSGGGQWFIVETPSMGQAAPVGTLVLTTPVTASDLRVGDVITFHPPTEPKAVYTHRIVDITARGIVTRGDINGATDPWALSQKDLVGEATTILPRLGWLIRALPILLVGSVFVMLLTHLIRNPARRQSYRILGFSMLASLSVYVLRPFVGLIVLTTTPHAHGASAQVVSTGLLPISVSAKHGTTVDLVAGQVGTVTVNSGADMGRYSLSSALHLTLPEWILFGAICAIPLLWTFVVGLPGTPDEEEGE